jgi:hypothetical protein
MYEAEYEKVIDEMEKNLKQIVTRRDLSEALGGLVAYRTWANRDSLGTGPEVKIKIGRTVGYPKQAVMDWLRKNLTITKC